jgi:hypothetical protein
MCMFAFLNVSEQCICNYRQVTRLLEGVMVFLVIHDLVVPCSICKMFQSLSGFVYFFLGLFNYAFNSLDLKG